MARVPPASSIQLRELPGSVRPSLSVSAKSGCLSLRSHEPRSRSSLIATKTRWWGKRNCRFPALTRRSVGSRLWPPAGPDNLALPCRERGASMQPGTAAELFRQSIDFERWGRVPWQGYQSRLLRGSGPLSRVKVTTRQGSDALAHPFPIFSAVRMESGQRHKECGTYRKHEKQ